MPRPKTIDDAGLLAAAARVMGRRGPRFTLADVGREAGLSPATLVQRFGTKRGLMLALFRQGAEGAGQWGPPNSRKPLGALITWLASCADLFKPEEIANHIAFLHMDLTDPEFHHLAKLQGRGFRKLVKRALEDAIRSGELKPLNAARLARIVHVAYNGALITWAVLREGSLRRWMRRCVTEVLAPYSLSRSRVRQR